MARGIRLEVEGELYRLIVRGNDRKKIFRSRVDHGRYLAMLGAVRAKLLFTQVLEQYNKARIAISYNQVVLGQCPSF